jgi:type II secretory pathway pseudopilin PulG
MAPGARRREAGFTYLGLVILVTIIGLVGAATLKVDSLLRRAAAEEELLETGAAFSAALQSYAAATPKGQPTWPRTLDDLLKDPRFPGLRRHLRKIFVDPLTGKAEWGVVYAGDRTGVLAVYSLSAAKPLKIANFDSRFLNFENKEHISDWKFTANGQGAVLIAVAGADEPRPAPAPQARQASAPEEARAQPATGTAR